MSKLSALFSRFARHCLLSLGATGLLASALPVQAQLGSGTLDAALHAEVALVFDLDNGTRLYEKNSDELRPIASITKLMTALVVLDSSQPLDEVLTISSEDIDRMRHSRSRLAVGTRLTRGEMLHLALMSSENRAANALGRHYPGGLPAFVRAMNDKARELGMRHSRFVEPTGLSSDNVANSHDLVKLLRATNRHTVIRDYATDDTESFQVGRGRILIYNNTNRLVKRDDWDIRVSKTGFINEAGQCLVMLTRIGERDLAIVLLNADGRAARLGDAARLRQLVEAGDRTLALASSGS